MLLKNTLAAFTIAGLAAASPAGDIEARSTSMPCATGTPFCCATAFPLSIFFVQGVGTNCQLARDHVMNGLLSCTAVSGHTAPLCCDSNNAIQDPKTNNVVCIA